MAKLDKFKDLARKFEQKEQWPKAIEQLLKALEAMEKSPEDDTDLTLYNRLGDLYQKTGDSPLAVTYYERAAEKYAEGGFHNNAIALCNKILRLSPGRSSVYLKLGTMFAAKGFLAEAKQNMLEYADRMQKAGQIEEAFKALKAFAEMTPGQDDIWAVLAAQARAAAKTNEQKEQVDKLLAEFEHKDRSVQRKSRMSRSMLTGEELPPELPSRRELVFLDLGDTPSPRKSGAPRVPVVPEPVVEAPPMLEIESTALSVGEEPLPTIPVLEIEPTALDHAAPATPDLVLEPTSLAGADLVLEPTSLVAEPPVAAVAEPEMLDLDVSEPPAPAEEPVTAADAMAGLPLMEIEEEPPAAAADLMAGLPLLEVEEAAPAAAALPFFEVEEEVPAAPEAAEPAAEPVVEVAEPAAEPVVEVAEPAAEPVVEVAEPAAEPAVAAAVEFMDLGDVQEQVPTVAALEARIASAPDDWDAHRRLGEVLLDEGQRERGLAELDVALDGFEQADRLEDAYGLNEEILRVERNSIRHQQKRVELSYRQNDRVRLVDAYNELADALLRTNDADRAVAVYRRVLEHDPTNDRARAALDTLAPPPSAPVSEAPSATRMSTQRPAVAAPAGGYVDLGSFLMEDDAGPMDTRMKVEDEEPTGDEEADFQSMLQAFKKGIAANVGEEDFQSHFDLGVAYKEMGLLDEAIAEFQKALRAVDGRLKSSEALGVCFFEKGQFAVAETILRRGLEHQGASEAERIGLLYWLGRAYEEQGKSADALTSYNRVFGVDINFQDVNQRVRALSRTGA
jgi:tetratricopeptide (TPR) repeat protein